jgi:hypothetical protein
MNRKAWCLLLAMSASLFPACKKSEGPVIESKSETKATNPDGSKTTTSTEEKQVGSTVEATTETKTSGKDGGKSESETVVGTVTAFEAGKSITVLTGDGSKHSYDLADDKTSASIDRRVTVGTKVRLDSDKDSAGRKTIRVAPSSEK